MRRCLVSVFGVFALVALLQVDSSSAKRILGVFPIPSKSHWAVGSSVLRALGEAGHDVTVITPFIMANSSTANFRTIHLSGVEDELLKGMAPNKMTSWMMKIPGLTLVHLSAMGLGLSKATMEHENVVKFLADKSNQFDLVIVEQFCTDTIFGFAEYYKAPVMVVFPTSPMQMVNDLVGNPAEDSYVPNIFLPHTPKMSLFQRVYNKLFGIAERFAFGVIAHSRHSALYQKYFPNNDKSLTQIMKEDVSMVFVNTHFSLSHPRPNVPNMIEIGGINIDRKLDKLPEEFQKFLDGAKEEGVILFTMGSFLQASDFSPEQLKELISAFGKLKQKVIWRYNLPDADQLPKNILTKEWLPQKEILAHPNVKLFITHGGMLGTTEGVYNGKPMIGIPVLGDQHENIARAVSRGYALKLNKENLSEESLTKAIKEILGNPKYTEKVKQLSAVLRDQPWTPQEAVVYWSEYVMRHNGAKHMHVEAKNLGFLATSGLDVLLVVLLLVLVPNILLAKCILKKICKRTGMCNKNSNTKIKKN